MSTTGPPDDPQSQGPVENASPSYRWDQKLDSPLPLSPSKPAEQPSIIVCSGCNEDREIPDPADGFVFDVDWGSAFRASSMAADLTSLAGTPDRSYEKWTPEQLKRFEKQAVEIVTRVLVKNVPNNTEINNARLKGFAFESLDEIRKVAPETIEHVAYEILRNPQLKEKLYDLVRQASQPPEGVNQVTDEIATSRGLERSDAVLAGFVIACFVLLTGGITIPLVAGLAGEVIFTNTVAAATLVVTTAALLQRR